MRGTRALAAAATGTLGPLCAAAWLVASFRGERCVAGGWLSKAIPAFGKPCRASVVRALERTQRAGDPKQLQKSCVAHYYSASSRPPGPSRRPRSCGHRSLSRMRPTPRVLCQSPMKRSPSRGAQSCRARCAALPRCRCPRNASPVALKLHVTHAFGTLRRQKSTPAETHQH